MSVDDYFIPLPVPPHERHAKLDPDETAAAADSSAVSACWRSACGDGHACSNTLRSLNRPMPIPVPVPVPSRLAGAPIGQLPETPNGSERRHHLLMMACRDDSCLHLRSPSLYETSNLRSKEDFHGQGSAQAFSALSLQELKDAFRGRPKQCHPTGFAVSRTAPRGRYARSKAGWASKERSTPEGYNREEHSWRFESPFPQGMSTSSIIDAYIDAFPAPAVVHPPKKKKSLEERKAIREKKILQSERDSLRHVETALRKYNRANNTTFELDEITVKCQFFEFGVPCYHYNFTAKPENHHSADGSTKLFFSEINCPLRSENDVLLCCIVGEKDAGHCHACEDYRPMMVHPSSRAYGGGNTTAIDYPDEDSSSSDSDY